MDTRYSKKLRVVFAGTMLALALHSAPATAHSNNHGYAAPLAAFVAFSWLSHHSHHGHSHHYYHQSRSNHYHGHKRRHSYSSGGNHKRRNYSH